MGEYAKTYGRINALKIKRYELQEQIEKLQEEIASINEEIGDLEGYLKELNYIDNGGNNSDEW